MGSSTCGPPAQLIEHLDDDDDDGDDDDDDDYAQLIEHQNHHHPKYDNFKGHLLNNGHLNQDQGFSHLHKDEHYLLTLLANS